MTFALQRNQNTSNPQGVINSPQPQTTTAAKAVLLYLIGRTWHRVLPDRDTVRASITERSAAVGTPRRNYDVCGYRNMRYRFSTTSVMEERGV